MDLGNVLVIGNSGVGKSTLINAVLGEHVAETGYGITGKTKGLKIYEPKDNLVPFRLIDSVGFEPSLVKRIQAIDAVKKWSKDAVFNKNRDTSISVIWFCIDGAAAKLFPDTVKALVNATRMWKTVPVITVITKSYDVTTKDDNIKMVEDAFASVKFSDVKPRYIIPVVAATLQVSDSAFAAPYGIPELIEATNKLMPEGKQAAKDSINKFILDRKRVLAHGVVAGATAAGATIGAVPIPIPDGTILTPLEVGLIKAIASVYGVKSDEKSKKFFESLLTAGTVGVVAKTVIGGLRAIPGVNIAAAVLNAIMAGVIVASFGEVSISVFEKIYTGEKSVDDPSWLKDFIENKIPSISNKIAPIIAKIPATPKKEDILKAVGEIVNVLFKK